MQFQELNIEPKYFIVTIGSNDLSYQKKDKNQNILNSNIDDFKNELKSIFKQKNILNKELIEVKKTLNSKINILFLLKLILIGFILNSMKKEIEQLNDYIQSLETNIQNCLVKIEYQFDLEKKKSYLNLIKHFNNLSKSKKIWDITSQTKYDGTKDRSHATSLIDRKESFFSIDSINIIETEYSIMFFKNINGNDFYISPSFLISFDGFNDIKMVELDDIHIDFDTTNFIESSSVPSDAKIISYTWRYMNKNGGPDKRFNDNYKIPLVSYAELEFKSNKIKLSEKYQISNIDFTKSFVNSFKEYQNQDNLKSGGLKIGMKDLL